MTKQIITLTTDFGLKDPYVAEMKAVILNICPEAIIIDISHGIEKFNIRMAAYVLSSASSYFPKDTIHVAVVDPGVGTERRALIIETEQSQLVGPDNGVLTLTAQKQGIKHIYEITNPKFMLPEISNTFHGRDIFAASAAHLANGVPPKDFGAETKVVDKPNFANVEFKDGILIGEVLHVDEFGNIITNIEKQNMAHLPPESNFEVVLGKSRMNVKLAKSYGMTKQHETLILVGSHGYFEIAINQGNAGEKLQAKIGDSVSIYVIN